MVRSVGSLLAMVLAALVLAAGGPIGCAPTTGGSGGSCCRYCSTGKPCGDSCIRRSYTCHEGPGCACYGNHVDPELEHELMYGQQGGWTPGEGGVRSLTPW